MSYLYVVKVQNTFIVFCSANCHLVFIPFAPFYTYSYLSEDIRDKLQENVTMCLKKSFAKGRFWYFFWGASFLCVPNTTLSNGRGVQSYTAFKGLIWRLCSQGWFPFQPCCRPRFPHPTYRMQILVRGRKKGVRARAPRAKCRKRFLSPPRRAPPP